MPHQIGLDIGMRVLDRIPHPRLRAEMDDAVEVLAFEHLGELGHAGEVLLVEGKAIAAHFAQGSKAILLEADLIIVVDVIDADNAVAAREELAGEAVANEPGGAGDEGAHGGSVVIRLDLRRRGRRLRGLG